MPSVDPTQYLLTAISNLTGGLISDIQSLFLGLLVCSFILMGLDLLKDAIASAMESRNYDKYHNDAKDLYHERSQYQKGTPEYE
jgi:hypothetical protein